MGGVEYKLLKDLYRRVSDAQFHMVGLYVIVIIAAYQPLKSQDSPVISCLDFNHGNLTLPLPHTPLQALMIFVCYTA